MTLDGPARVVAEAVVTLPLLGGATAASMRYLRRAGAEDRGPSLGMLWALAAGVLALSFWSLRYAQFPHRLAQLAYEWNLSSLPFFLWQVLYVLVFGALGAMCVRGLVDLARGAGAMASQGMRRTLTGNADIRVMIEYWPWGIAQAGGDPRSVLRSIREMGFQILEMDDQAAHHRPESDDDQMASRGLQRQHMNLLLQRSSDIPAVA